MEEQDNKERILRGAEELFMRYGVRSVSMDDIARHLSISKKTIYQYFTDKDEVVTMVAIAHLSQEQREFDEVFTKSKDSIDEMVGLSNCLRVNLKKINPSMLFDMQKYHPKAWGAWLSFKNDFMRMSIKRSLTRGIQDGYFRPEINSEILATSRLEQVEMGFRDDLFPTDQFDFMEVQIQLLEVFIYGLLTEKGRKLYQTYKLKNQPTQ